jgi:hypothetical protein
MPTALSRGRLEIRQNDELLPLPGAVVMPMLFVVEDDDRYLAAG